MPRTLNLDTGLLRCFVAVAETGSFTAAGARVLRSQSAVSLQIKRLEELLESRLIERSPRHLALTPSGETLLVRARDILRLNDEAVAAVDAPGIRGAVSVGVPEDFATVHMPDVFAQFARSFTKVDLRVTCDLTLNLLARFRRDEFDLILIKREPEQRRNRSSLGMRVWRERLVWISGPHTRIDRGETLNLVVSPEPCVYRKRAVEALKAKGWNARVVYECAALSGALAAVRAGLGITVLPKGMAEEGLTIIDDGRPLPDLDNTEIAIIAKRPLSAQAARLQAHIIRRLEMATI